MVYIDGIDKWMDIYLASWDDGDEKLESVNGGTIIDGDSGTPGYFNWYNFVEEFGKVGKHLPMQQDFIPAANGCPEGTERGGDPGETGGHDDENGRRIISNYGMEDAAGVMWQWGADGGPESAQGANWEPADTYDETWDYDNTSNDEGDSGSYDHDIGVHKGAHYDAPNRPVFGGWWGSGAICGSRCSIWNVSPLYLAAKFGARGVSNPRGGR